MERLQEVWGVLGVDLGIREQDLRDIQSSLKDTCSRKLKEALSMKVDTEREIKQLSHRLVSMQKALGISADVINIQSGSDLVENLRKLRMQVDQLETPYKYAAARRERIIMVTDDFFTALGLSTVQLPSNLRALMEQNEKGGTSSADIGRRRRASMMEGIKSIVDALNTFEVGTNLEGIAEEEQGFAAPDEDKNEIGFVVLPANCLENDFLSSCESDIAELRVQKSEILMRSRELQQEIYVLVHDMHLSVRDSIAVLEYSVNRKEKVIPEWWSRERAEGILRAITTSAYQTGASTSDAQHLELIHETLGRVANSRRSLSTALRTIVERAQETLLDIVGRELDASEAYASFHDALFRLPALSKDLTLACISEMEALIIGVDAMTQSEIEALTVVWEALNISSGDRRDFWGRVENPNSATDKATPFDKFEGRLVPDSEEWIVAAVQKAIVVYRDLDKKLRKLDGIHKDVEELRSRQDTKSQIISLDSEIRILNVKLQDFEELQCNKQRLLTKKSSGSSLLKEERFRKQMQGKFVSKLGQLTSLLRSWEKKESKSFDASLLSDDVRALLDEPDKMENWVKKRTKCMPLRTVQTKTPARKRPPEAAISQSMGGNRSLTPRKRIAQTTSKSTQHSRTKPEQNDQHSDSTPESVLFPSKQKVTSKPANVRRDKQKRTRNDYQGEPVVTNSSSASKTSTKRLKRKESTTLPPFGRILSEVPSPSSDVKENVQS
jgi:hypothetical protein